ncbi:MAG TPA: von Willebrand factor type A domain-containing protein [Steroidobacteraceae bacterium]|nr:von Willebrand factor type A domain-containing protein [Steroidobacteraceae bacterium]
MKDRSIAEQLQDLDAPAPRAEARAAARQAALAELARVQAERPAAGVTPVAATSTNNSRQGFWSRFRLSRQQSHDGSRNMKWLVSRSALGGLASVGVVSLAAALLWPMFMENRALQQVAPPIEADIVEEVREVPPPRVENLQPVDVPMPALAASVDASAVAEPAPANGATPPGPPPPFAKSDYQKDGDVNDVTVTGLRGRLQQSLEIKREAVGVVDSITAEDIGTLPEKNTAESLQRLQDVKLASAAKSKGPQPLQTVGTSTGNLVVLSKEAPKPGFEAEGDDKFQHFEVNPIKAVAAEPVSTFSVDVDTASYSFARRMINEGRLPQKDAVRVEEMVNYFGYSWPQPESRKVPFKATIAVSDSPWTKGKKLVHIGIKGYDIDRDETPDSNLVFLMDVSGSMDSPDKLPLAVASMKLLLQKLKPTDTVGIVVYAGAAGTVLEPTAVRDEGKILRALDSLQAGGSTAGAEGIELAYQLAEKSFRKGGVNRVMLATDGDFNVGIAGTEELKSFIERKREKGIFLSVLGFGQGNYRDELAQALAQNGNGVAAYIDTLNEAKKVLVEQATGSLFTIAKDVKLQVEFNPATVAEYRLVGYETRALKREDFNNDRIDAGDVGAGHTVTALYEITPVGSSAVSVDALRYGVKDADIKKRPIGSRDEYGFLKIRYKLPNEDTSTLISQPIPLETPRLAGLVDREVRFSTAVAGFAQLLKGGAYTGKLGYDDVIEAAQAAKGEDRNGYRAEFIELVRKAKNARAM